VIITKLKVTHLHEHMLGLVFYFINMNNLSLELISIAVDEKSMLRYIRDKTAAPYFSNLVWFIGNHVLDLDRCVRHDIE
jgi:hypothetical protein